MPDPIVRGRYNIPQASGGRTSPTVRPHGPSPVPAHLPTVKAFLSDDQFERLLRSIWREVDVLMLPFVATNAAGGAIQLLPQHTRRSYLFIQNQSGAAQLICNFGSPPGAIGTIPANGIIIGAFPGFYEPIAVPRNELWVAASAPATPGLLIYSIH